MNWLRKLLDKFFPPEEPITLRLKRFIYEHEIRGNRGRIIECSPDDYEELIDELKDIKPLYITRNLRAGMRSVYFCGCIVRPNPSLPLGHWRIV